MDLRRALIAEFVGTFMFITIGAGSVIVTNSNIAALGLFGVAAAHGLALAVVVTAFQEISGGHMNPAITVSLWVGGRVRVREAVTYIVAQLAGAVAAGGLLLAIFSKRGEAAQLGTPGPQVGVTSARAILIEAVFTFFLLIAYWATVADERGRKIGGFGVGLTLFVTMLIAGQLTGGVVNPARHFGTGLVAGSFNKWWLYWLGPLSGAVLAGVFYPTLLGDRGFPWRLVPTSGATDETPSGRRPRRRSRGA
jgi:MIP family channel proteins